MRRASNKARNPRMMRLHAYKQTARGFKSHVVCSRKNNLPLMDIRSADEFEGDGTAILTKPILFIGIRA